MKKHLLLTLSLFILAFASCKKDSGDAFNAQVQAAADDAAIQTYLKANTNINATKDASGLYYQVITDGTGANPTTSSTITASYDGKVLNGAQFATAAPLNNVLSDLIKGFQIGIPKVKSGGKILLIIPSALAYGPNSPTTAIPANSVLIFTVNLTSVK